MANLINETNLNDMSNSTNSSTVLVAGATGFLGSEICRQLIEQNKKVKALVRATSDSNKVGQLKESGVEIIEGDLKNKTSLENALHGVSAIISTVSSTLSRQDVFLLFVWQLAKGIHLIHKMKYILIDLHLHLQQH